MFCLVTFFKSTFYCKKLLLFQRTIKYLPNNIKYVIIRWLEIYLYINHDSHYYVKNFGNNTCTVAIYIPKQFHDIYIYMQSYIYLQS